MKKNVQKAQDLISAKKQMTFDVPDAPQTEEKRKKTTSGKPKSTYWVCVKGHVFKHKYQVHHDWVKNLNCPVCGGAVKNKSTKSTYLYYLSKAGRGDVKDYRADKVRREKKQRMKKKTILTRDDTEQESDA